MPDTAPKKVFTHREILVILSGLMTGMLLAALDQTIVSTALKSIVEDFNGLSHYTWVVTAYLLTSTASTPSTAKSRTFMDVAQSSNSRSSHFYLAHSWPGLHKI